jgi:LAO/AO transport system kinase
VNLRGLSAEEVVARALAGDRRATGRALSLVEGGGDRADAVTAATFAHTRGAHVIGVTGPPGAGKSTLVARVVAAIAAAGSRPAVLAVDPSSPLTGGAILGDRVRMAEIDATTFIRSVATRGHAGGLALAIPGAVRLLDAAGYDPIVIETVGVGQVEVDVTATADTTLVVVNPGMGDAVQANKAGLLEVADLFAVNKADVDGAADTRRDLELMLDLSHVTGLDREPATNPGRRPPILMTVATTGEGIDDVVAALVDHREMLAEDGRWSARRARRARFELAVRVNAGTDRRLRGLLDDPRGRALVDDVVAGRRDPVSAAHELGDRLAAR